MTRFVPVTVLVMLLAGSRVASAQVAGTDTLPNSAQIVFEHRKIVSGTSFTEPNSNSTELLHYFNLAHCNCAKANVGNTAAKQGIFSYLVRETAMSMLHVPVHFFAGTSCEDSTHRGGPTATCTPLQTSSINDLDTQLNTSGGTTLAFNLFQVVNANLPATTTECQQLDNVGNSIYALVGTKMETSLDYFAAVTAGGLKGETGTVSGIDTRPPPLPTDIRADGGDQAIHLAWTAPIANNTDVAYYQALCANLDGTPALSSKSNDPQYVTSASLCGATGDPALMPTPVGSSQADVETPLTAPTGDFATLDPRYICGQVNTGTSTSLDIAGLENGTPYRVILVSVDLHGNYTGAYFTSTVTPVPSTDFWEDLHGRGSKTEGGLCLLAETYGDDSGLTGALRAFRDDTLGGSRLGRWLTRAYYATLGQLGGVVHGSIALRIVAGILLAPAVVFALLWHWLTLPGVLGLVAAAWWLVRRRGPLLAWGRRALGARAVRVAAAVAVVTLGAGRAHAGGGYQPYWEDSDPTTHDDQRAPGPEDVRWHVGIRVGPYVPDIDKQLGMDPGPYKQMFPGTYVMPMLDVDRVLWSGFGQLGVGVSVGYLGRKARAFTLNSKPTDDPRARGADVNKFRMIPTAVTAVYRFTWLDDEYGIPVVPYARAGLSYYVWWVSLANGKFAEACTDGSMTAGCTTTKGLGGSLGVQGSIGLAIRAERIDASAAMSMRQSGIQHAGIYGELSAASVSGFGSDKKLSVGDRTWFAGVEFEF